MDETRSQARASRNDATDAERQMWRYLQGRRLGGLRFRRQAPIAGYIADFVCPASKLVIELDGGQHADQQEYDARRNEVLEAKGYRVLRYWNDDVLMRVEAVLDDVLRVIGEMRAGGGERRSMKRHFRESDSDNRNKDNSNSDSNSNRNRNSNSNGNGNGNGNGTPPQPSPPLREREGAKSEALLECWSGVAAGVIREPRNDQEPLPPFREAKGRVGEGLAFDHGRHAEFDPVGMGMGMGMGMGVGVGVETETETNSPHPREVTP